MMHTIAQAIQIIKQGGVGIVPTDTVYGICCRLDNEAAIQRVFTLRHRPEEKAVLVVVDSLEMAQEYLLPIPSLVREKLITNFWPGPLTIVLPCQTERVSAVARAQRQTLAIRQTNHPLLLQILQKVRVPLILPSANFAGKKTPTKFIDIDKKLLNLVDFAIDVPTGGNTQSTIIDCSSLPWKIVREGAVHLSI